MTPGLDDTVFSALIPSVNESGNYRVAYESAKSDDFSITIFEYPELQQADATVTPPAYLDEELKEVTDTRKITGDATRPTRRCSFCMHLSRRPTRASNIPHTRVVSVY